ncbi:MAG: glycerol-3-phosphate dehydrogenase (NAD(P)+), partial [Planctomycetota bacterium]
MNKTKVTKALVLGDGSWGTTLACVQTTLWSAFPEQSQELRDKGVNERFLPGVPLPEDLAFSADPFSAAEGAQLVISVVPTQYLRSVAMRFEDALPGNLPIVSATKGLEVETFDSPTAILKSVLGER